MYTSGWATEDCVRPQVRSSTRLFVSVCVCANIIAMPMVFTVPMKCIYTWKVLRRKSSKSLGINMQLKIIFGLERRTLYVCVCCPSKCDCSINIINIQLHHSRNNQFLASKHFALNKLNSNSDNSIEKFCMTNESKEHPHNPNGSKRSYPERRERERGGYQSPIQSVYESR